MHAAGTDFIISCMTVNGNIELAKAAKEYGVKANMLFFTIINQTVLNKDSSLIQGAYFTVESVPALANEKFPGVYPGLSVYLAAMKKYSPPTPVTTMRCWVGSPPLSSWLESRLPGRT